MARKAEERISVSAYARLLGVDEKTVRNAVRDGKIKRGFDVDKKKIIPTVADKEWGNTKKAVKPARGVSRVKAIEKIEKIKKASPNQPQPDVDMGSIDPDKDLDDEGIELLSAQLQIRANMDAGEAMRIGEIIKAALDKKKLEEAEGTLVKKEEVDKELYAFGAELKKALFAMPVRIARDVMAASTEIEAIKIMTEELTNLINEKLAFSENDN